jgi:hypothetical protein
VWITATPGRGRPGKPPRPAGASSRGSSTDIPASCRPRSPGPWRRAPAWRPTPGAAGRRSAGPPPRGRLSPGCGRRPPGTVRFRCGPGAGLPGRRVPPGPRGDRGPAAGRHRRRSAGIPAPRSWPGSSAGPRAGRTGRGGVAVAEAEERLAITRAPKTSAADDRPVRRREPG